MGSSRGIRIPKPIIEQCGFGNTVQLQIEKGRLVISPDRGPRAGWDEAFALASSDEPELRFDFPPSDFEREEWQW